MCDICGECVHAETEWVVTTEPTCEENGVETEYCTVCEYPTGRTREIKALGHVDADKDGKCDDCGKAVEEEHKHADADKDGNCDDCGEKVPAADTGDNTNIALYAVLMMAAAAVVVFKRRRVEA